MLNLHAICLSCVCGGKRRVEGDAYRSSLIIHLVNWCVQSNQSWPREKNWMGASLCLGNSVSDCGICCPLGTCCSVGFTFIAKHDS